MYPNNHTMLEEHQHENSTLRQQTLSEDHPHNDNGNGNGNGNSTLWQQIVLEDIQHENERLRHHVAQLEHEQFETRRLLQTIVDALPQAIFWKDHNLTYLGCNAHFASIAGVANPADMIGTTDNQLPWKPEETEFFQTVDQRVMESNTAEHDIVESLLQASGKQTWLKTSKIPLRDLYGHVYGILGFFEDITERKHIEQELHDSEVRFRVLFEHTADAIVLLSENGFVDGNQAALKLFRAESKNDLLYKSPADLSPEWQPDGRCSNEKAQEMVARAIEHGSHRFEWVHRRCDGTDIAVEVMLTSITIEGQTILHSTLRDITERKRVEEMLRNREAILQTVAFAGEQLLGTNDLNASISSVLENLGTATRVDRVYMFEHATASPGKLVARLRYEWTAPGIRPRINNPDFQNMCYHDAGLERWVSLLSQHQPVTGPRFRFSDAERAMLEAQGIASIAIVPLFIGQQWWGYIGFDVYHLEREWSLVEIDALKVAVSMIGSAIQARESELERQQLQQDIIETQQATLRELSSPLIPLTDRVMIMPLVGSIDDVRAQQITETLLEGMSRYQAELAILDITGVTTVNTHVAHALVGAAQAVKLLGARVMLTGIQPQIVQTLVHLGVEFRGIQTMGSLQAGIAAALR